MGLLGSLDDSAISDASYTNTRSSPLVASHRSIPVVDIGRDGCQAEVGQPVGRPVPAHIDCVFRWKVSKPGK